MTWQDESSTECQIKLEENTVHHREPGSSAQQQVLVQTALQETTVHHREPGSSAQQQASVQTALQETTVHHREPGYSAQQQADINSESYVVCIVSETVIIIKSMDS